MPEVSKAPYFTPEALALWREAISALHAFAKASGCPLGYDVAVWFVEETKRFDQAQRTPPTT